MVITGFGNYHLDGGPGADNDWNFTSEVTYTCNSDGTVSCSAIATGEFQIDHEHEADLTGSCDFGDTDTFMSFGGTEAWVYGESFNCSICPKNDEIGWELTTDACNHKHYTLNSPFMDRTGEADAITVYSDPCVPSAEVFSPAP